jgi:hypothetical protein
MCDHEGLEGLCKMRKDSVPEWTLDGWCTHGCGQVQIVEKYRSQTLDGADSVSSDHGREAVWLSRSGSLEQQKGNGLW